MFSAITTSDRDAVPGRRGLERRRAHHRELGRVAAPLVVGRHDEQVADEQAVPRVLADHAHREAIGRVGPGVQVLDEEFALAEVGDDVGAQRREVLRRSSAG